jgi:hypothetical protein
MPRSATRPATNRWYARPACRRCGVAIKKVYGIPPEQVVSPAGGRRYGYDKSGRPFLTKEPKLLLHDAVMRRYWHFLETMPDRCIVEQKRCEESPRRTPGWLLAPKADALDGGISVER